MRRVNIITALAAVAVLALLILPAPANADPFHPSPGPDFETASTAYGTHDHQPGVEDCHGGPDCHITAFQPIDRPLVLIRSTRSERYRPASRPARDQQLTADPPVPRGLFC